MRQPSSARRARPGFPCRCRAAPAARSWVHAPSSCRIFPLWVARKGTRTRRSARWRQAGTARSTDRRFKDHAWKGNPAFRRLSQTYLANGRATDKLIGDPDLDWRTERRIRFASENVLDAIAPTNVPQLNPAALKATLDTGGANLPNGARNFAPDMARPPRIPAMVDTTAFEVGENIATTKGAVVLRTPVFSYPVRAEHQEGARAPRR